MSFLNWAGQWMRGHLTEIAFSITAMVLVVGGPYINAAAKRLSQKFHWVLRYALFVLLSTVGYGLLTNFGLRNLRGFLVRMTNVELILAVLAAHLVLAWLLKRDRAI